jgi:hypothetical protein
MAAFNKFNVFTQDLATGGHVFGTNTFKLFLTNAAPAAANTAYGGTGGTPAEIAAGNGYTAGGNATTITISNTGGVEKMVGTNPAQIVAAGGTIGPFRYVVLYNATSTKLIGWYDYGSAITLAIGETFDMTPDATNGLLTIT